MDSNRMLGLSTLDARTLHSQELAKKGKDSPKTQALRISATFSSPRFLPVELWKLIIDHLEDDSQTLRACMFISRIWREFARRHLYRRFVWRPCACDYDEEGLIGAIHPYPHLIRHLVLDWDDSALNNPDWLMPLAGYLDQFTSVRHLELGRIDWDGVLSTSSWNVFSSASAFLSQVKTIDLIEMPIYPFDYISQIVSIFPGLERLYFFPSEFDTLDKDEDNFAVFPGPPSTLRVFSSEDSPCALHARDFWKWFSAPMFLKLEVLRLNDVPNDDLPFLASYLHLLGPTLKHFRIRFSHFGDSETFTENQVLFKSTGLEHLEVGGTWTVAGCSTLLSNIPGQCLRKLTFFDTVIEIEPETKSVVEVDTSLWSSLDTLLAGSQFAVLEEIVFDLREGSSDGDACGCSSAKMVKDGLSGCESRGLLSFVDVLE